MKTGTGSFSKHMKTQYDTLLKVKCSHVKLPWVITFQISNYCQNNNTVAQTTTVVRESSNKGKNS